MTIYAIVESGGKQYKVSPGQTITVDKFPVEGDTVELDRVYLVADGEKVTLGRPTVEGAKVIATVLGEGRGKKIIVFKYKSKVRYRKKTGHRQSYIKLEIKDIVLAGGVKTRSRRKETPKEETPKEEGLNDGT